MITDEIFLARGEDAFQHIATPSTNAGDMVIGTALEMKPEELQIADQYEPPGFTPVKVMLASGKDAWIYEAVQ